MSTRKREASSAKGAETTSDSTASKRKKKEQNDSKNDQAKSLLVTSSNSRKRRSNSRKRRSDTRPRPDKPTFICIYPGCTAVYSSIHALNGHIGIHGGIRSKEQNNRTSTTLDKDGFYPCRRCGRVFDKINSRNSHMKSHVVRGGRKYKPQREKKISV